MRFSTVFFVSVSWIGLSSESASHNKDLAHRKRWENEKPDLKSLHAYRPACSQQMILCFASPKGNVMLSNTSEKKCTTRKGRPMLCLLHPLETIHRKSSKNGCFAHQRFKTSSSEALLPSIEDRVVPRNTSQTPTF